jgi:hypothetical protein
MAIKGEEKMSNKYYIYEISTRKVVEIIDVDLEYDWEQYGGTWDPEGLILDSCGADAANEPEEELTELEGDTLWSQD